MTVAVLQIVAIFLCVFGAAFFSGMETGVISIRRLRLRHYLKEGRSEARLLSDFLERPDRLLGTTLVGTNLCVVVASVVSVSLAAGLWGAWGEPAVSVGMSLVILVFGEYMPKTWFRARPYPRAARFVRLLRVAWLVLKPVVTVVTWLAGLLIPGADTSRDTLSQLATRAELKLLAREGERHGVLTPDERSMIHRIIELSEKTARDVMESRSDMTCVDSLATVSEFLDTARKAGYTRFPVFDAEQDQFVGMVNVFDVLTAGDARRKRPLSEFLRPPVLISAETPADDIFPRLRGAGQPMGMVVEGDAGQAVIGLVTMEDVLEEIVGEL